MHSVAMSQRAKKGGSLAATALPFGIFVLAGWYGLANIVQTKRDLRVGAGRNGMERGLAVRCVLSVCRTLRLPHLFFHIWPQIATKGLDALEEMDPVERMRQRYGLDSNNQRSLGSQPVRSLEDELKTLQETLDINNFDYKPVPRTEDEE